MINYGLKNGHKLTKKNATDILSSCGPDLRKWFIKPLIEMVELFPLKWLKDPKSYRTWDKIPDAINGFEFIVDFFDKKNVR